MSDIKISIIVPAYNAEKTLNRCMDSLLSQTIINDIEIILVDDGSTDNTPTMCDTYACNETVKVIHQKNGGLSNARNSGLKIAQGDYVLFCDSDDYVTSDYAEVLYNSINESDYDLAICCFVSIDEKTGVQTKKSIESESPLDLCKADFLLIKSWDIFNIVWNKIYKADILKKNEILFDESIVSIEDVLFNLLYLKHTAGKIRVIPDPLYLYSYKEADNLGYINRFNFSNYELLLNEYSKHFDLFNVPKNELYTEFYSNFFANFYNCFKHIMFKEKSLSVFERYKKCRKILKSKSLTTCINKMDKSRYVPIFLFIIKSKSVILNYLFIKLVK